MDVNINNAWLKKFSRVFFFPSGLLQLLLLGLPQHAQSRMSIRIEKRVGRCPYSHAHAVSIPDDNKKARN